MPARTHHAALNDTHAATFRQNPHIGRLGQLPQLCAAVRVPHGGGSHVRGNGVSVHDSEGYLPSPPAA